MVRLARVRRPPRAAMALVVVLVGCTLDEDGAAGPRIQSLMPTSAPVGDPVEIIGTGFCGEANGACAPALTGTVLFGAGEPAAVGEWHDGRISTSVPLGLGSGATTVVVTVDGVGSSPADFEVE